MDSPICAATLDEGTERATAHGTGSLIRVLKDILPNTERKPVLRRANRAMNPRLWGRRQFGGFRLGVILVRAEILAAVPLTRDELMFVR